MALAMHHACDNGWQKGKSDKHSFPLTVSHFLNFCLLDQMGFEMGCSMHKQLLMLSLIFKTALEGLAKTNYTFSSEVRQHTHGQLAVI